MVRLYLETLVVRRKARNELEPIAIFGRVFGEERSTRLDSNRIESNRIESRVTNPENEIPRGHLRFVLCTLKQSFANSSVSFGYRIIRFAFGFDPA